MLRVDRMRVKTRSMLGDSTRAWPVLARHASLGPRPDFESMGRTRFLFQYGLLHRGHRFGSLSILGTHLCPQRRHFQPDTENVALGTPAGGRESTYGSMLPVVSICAPSSS